MSSKFSWAELRPVVRDSLLGLKVASSERVDTFLDSIEPKMLGAMGLPLEEAKEYADAVLVNARGEMYILGIDTESALAQMVLGAIHVAVGVLRA